MSIEAEVLRRLMAFRERLGPELGVAFDTLAGRLGLFGRAVGRGYFSHPMALPVLEFPQWAAAHVARRGAAIAPAVVTALTEAAAMGYLHVRVQDDWFDEGAGEPHMAMMLSEALFARGLALLAPVVPEQSPFWDLFEEVWVGYGEAMVLERRLHKGEEPYDVEAFRKVLARSRPLVLLPAAVLFAAGRGEDVAAFEHFSMALVAAHQLFADLLDAEKDLAHANRTHILFRFAVKRSGDCEIAALRVALFGQGGFDAVVRDAVKELARARRAAESLAMPEAVHFLDKREQFMAEVQIKVFEAVFSGVRGGAADKPQ
jgi:hypothetical protein